MKKRIITGLLAAIMAVQLPVTALAAENNQSAISPSIVEGENEETASGEVLQGLEMKETVVQARDAEKANVFSVTDGQGEEHQALKNNLPYAIIMPTAESKGKKLFRGENVALKFTVLSRGVPADQYIIRVHKGTNTGGELVRNNATYFPAEAGIYTLSIWPRVSELESGTYTLECHAQSYINGQYVESPDTRVAFQFYVVNEKIPVQSLALNTTGAQMRLEQAINLEAGYNPKDTTDDTEVTWSVSNESVVKLSWYMDTSLAMKATTVGYGTAYITAQMGGHRATCAITVSPEVDNSFPFTDIVIQNSNWKYVNAKYVHANGLMNGISGTTWFKPDDPVNRAMFATVIYRMAGQPQVAYSNRFSDVPDGQYYSSAVMWANDNKIVNGMGDGSYGVSKNITRAQIAKMLYEYAKSSGKDVSAKKDLSSFTDVSAVKDWARGYMEWATAEGLISGKPNEGGGYRLDPEGEATRAECAKMLTMFHQKYK